MAMQFAISQEDVPLFMLILNDQADIGRGHVVYDSVSTLTVADDLAPTAKKILSDSNWRQQGLKKDLVAYASVVRHAREIAGVQIGHLTYSTDREARVHLHEAEAFVKDDPGASVHWKTTDGTFITLTAGQVALTAAVVRRHVQRAFSAEAGALAAIESGTVTTRHQVDSFFAGVG